MKLRANYIGTKGKKLSNSPVEMLVDEAAIQRFFESAEKSSCDIEQADYIIDLLDLHGNIVNSVLFAVERNCKL